MKLNDFKEYIQKELDDIKLIHNTSDYFDNYSEEIFNKVSRVKQLQLIMDEIRKFENDVQ